jgi:cell pole-organizing protein PopZ
MPAPETAGAISDDAGTSEKKAESTIQPMAVASPIIAQPLSAASPSTAAQRAEPLQTLANAEPKAMPATLQEHPAVDPTPTAAAAQSRTLEHVVGELLEPVIRQWLEANLPRLVEEVVHKEVARAVAAARSRSVV